MSYECGKPNTEPPIWGLPVLVNFGKVHGQGQLVPTDAPERFSNGPENLTVELITSKERFGRGVAKGEASAASTTSVSSGRASSMMLKRLKLHSPSIKHHPFIIPIHSSSIHHPFIPIDDDKTHLWHPHLFVNWCMNPIRWDDHSTGDKCMWVEHCCCQLSVSLLCYEMVGVFSLADWLCLKLAKTWPKW